ncbi:molybdopterin-guanine dinucleotide biosynthesis protein B [Bacillus sp. ISL-35]|uniref:molybdopterin-guanine dinucleotide biosynthesis protein B n=1 Tax=Bacillus sp. ISL-35 TaxID=2819122 RepID=UPI001BE4EBD8|nr:molybdopterin-guanine dinucleotide biosynthesis protein B [Bacillus sp. ISL-35]MBT2678180.1 molybdopterin-guanine dinucleotide biosynthesis protein B [Bacillus sp. ISL-35]MBT2702533.1 molybdopterin-guanine dinucleotide biosynthesis protein B [Chryseobacterium sp. ISL-80]
MVKPVLFQVAGYQNSGKTTLSLSLIQQLSAAGLKVATIKHHGHGGKPDIAEEKDSGCHVSAGAAVSLIEGGGRLVLQAENGQWSLSEEIDVLSCFKTDVILIEGYKKEAYPKAVFLRDEADLELLNVLANIKVVFYHDPNLANLLKDCAYPVFQREDDRGVTWVLDYILNHV